ncbi:MAG: hypothetical protein GKR96_02175 [Gammaproteobacteria bacterium]|nr:hypothetical protein [Gammaproteobacteria bacterium]
MILVIKRTERTDHFLVRFLFSLAFITTFALLSNVVSAQQVPTTKDQPNYPEYIPSYAKQLTRVQVLIRSNVLDLAQRILETQGPPAVPSDNWINWERQLWSLYQSRKQWDMLYKRTLQIPPAFPARIHFEADTLAVSALIAMNKGSKARRLIRKNLSSTFVSELQKKQLRERIIESFLNDDLLLDATIAMEHYQHDYRSQSEDWLLLSARVYMQMGSLDRAINLLAPLTNPAARLLRIQARLDGGSMSPEQAISAVHSLLNNSAVTVNKLDALSVMISASKRSTAQLSIIGLLERYILAESVDDERSPAYEEYGVEHLFESYSNIALRQANRLGLLIGDHMQWLDYIEQFPLNDNTIKKSLYAYLCMNVIEATSKRKAMDGYINTLIGSGSTDLILAVFGRDKFLGELNLSADIGLYLSNYALEKGNVRLAAAVNNGLTEIPSGMKQEDWILHVARVSITAGDYEQGTDQLLNWVTSYSKLTPEQTDKVLQPVFDLQKVNQHKRALTLLHLISDRSSSERHQREIAYWLAESYQETKQYLQAADYFLYSALQKANGFDQWGESARFRAAESLVEANQVSDARSLFEDLLSRATEESRKTSLQQKLQQIWLLDSYVSTIRDGN